MWAYLNRGLLWNVDKSWLIIFIYEPSQNKSGLNYVFGKKQAVATRPVITFREQGPQQRMVSGEHHGAEIPVKDVRVLCQEARGTVGHGPRVMLDPENKKSVNWYLRSQSGYSPVVWCEKRDLVGDFYLFYGTVRTVRPYWAHGLICGYKWDAIVQNKINGASHFT